MPIGVYVKTEEHKRKISKTLKGKPQLEKRNTEFDFWNYVNIISENECWNWMGCKSCKGYGKFNFDGKKRFSHRLSWEFTHGKISNGKYILHSCDNPSCCNPKHLKEGTHIDNMEQMKIRKRRKHLIGEFSNNHKLTSSKVLQIRKMYLTNKYTYDELSREFNVSKSTTHLIVKRKTWKHI